MQSVQKDHALTRRLCIQSGLASLISCQVNSVAQAQNAVEQIGADKLPFQAINLPGERKVVAIFFDFACPICSKYHPVLTRWASSVPKSVKVFQYPVVNAADTIGIQEQAIAAKCFYAAASLATPAQLQTFITFIYEVRQRYSQFASGETPVLPGVTDSSSSPLLNGKTWIAAIRSAKINEANFIKLVNNNSTTVQSAMAGRKLIEYRIKATPSVGIAGKYILTPDSANGNEETFFYLLNGLVSEII